MRPRDVALALAPPLAVAAAIFPFSGLWALVGLVAGLLAALLARLWGLPPAGVVVGGALGAASGVGPPVVATAFVLALLVAWRRAGDDRVLLAGILALALPAPASVVAPAVAGALLVAVAARPHALAGAAIAAATWLRDLDDVPLAALALVGAALVARSLASHPANLSTARLLLRAGAAAAPVPALVGFLLAAVGASDRGAADVFPEVAVVVVMGGALLLAQVGAAATTLARDARPAAHLVLAWALPAAALGLVAQVGAREAAAAGAALVGIAALPAAVGATWAKSFAKSQTRFFLLQKA